MQGKRACIPAVEALRERGHDVQTLQELGEAGCSLPDDVVLQRASSDARAVLTVNRKDFFRLHRKSAQHAGIVACTFDPDFVRQARRIDVAVRQHASLEGLVIRVNRPDR